MTAGPTPFERAHYEKLVGRHIIAAFWEEIDGRPLPILLISGEDRDGNAATVAAMCDPEGNGPGHLEHSL